MSVSVRQGESDVVGIKTPACMENNSWMLLIAQNEIEQEENRRALIEADYPEANILTTTPEEAADFLSGRLHDARIKRPGLIIVDLDNTEVRIEHGSNAW